MRRSTTWPCRREMTENLSKPSTDSNPEAQLKPDPDPDLRPLTPDPRHDPNPISKYPNSKTCPVTELTSRLP